MLKVLKEIKHKVKDLFQVLLTQEHGSEDLVKNTER
jgi:hypothetical protein